MQFRRGPATVCESELQQATGNSGKAQRAMITSQETCLHEHRTESLRGQAGRACFLRTRPVSPLHPLCRGLFLMKCGSARVDSTGIRQSGEAALFAAQTGWLMTPRIWVLELDKKKSGSGCYASTGVRRMPEAALFSRTGQSAYDPRGRPLQLDKKKRGSAQKRKLS